MKQGFFISVEGMDGSGKTTQINLMSDYFKTKGYEVIFTREPGGTAISEEIRTMLLDSKNSEMNEITELLLYAAARAQLVHEVIKPAIESGKVVICDRFLDSSYAYQGFGRGIDLKIILDVNRAAIEGVLPDITFFFDISPKTALKRRSDSTGTDRIESEKMDFHMQVYSGYKKLAILYADRIKTIDSNREVEEIASDVRDYLEEILEVPKYRFL